MGNCLGGEASNNAANNQADNDKKKQDGGEIKVLLLGAGESGKSTIFKQMKILKQNGFNQEECMIFRDTIYGNILKNMKALVTASVTLEIPLENQENFPRAQTILAIEGDVLLSVETIWSEQMGNDIYALWQDPGIQKTFARRNEFQLHDSTPYFNNNLPRINQPDYIPTPQDVLNCRVKTTGMVEMEVNLDGKPVKFVDVGGQRNERKKWIHCFEGVSAIMFIVSLSEYDQKCYEDDSTNRMLESQLLFDEICNSRWFWNTTVILLFNKVDLFKEKIKTTDLKTLFEEYEGGCDFDKATEFIKNKYVALNKHKEKSLLVQFTCAVDTDSMKQVFDQLKNIVMPANTSTPV